MASGLQCVWNWVGLAAAYKYEQNGIPSNLKTNDKFNHKNAEIQKQYFFSYR